MTVPEHDDPLHDAIALVEAAGRDDALGCGAILRNMDAGAVVVNLVKLVAAALEDNARGHAVCADPECWRAWAEQAIERDLGDYLAMSDDAADDALLALAHELLSDLTAARVLELTGGQLDAYGQPQGPRDGFGRFQPPNPRPVSGWSHTLRHPANRTHLLENDPFMRELYGRGIATVAPAEHADHDPAAHPAPDATEEELAARHLYEAARGGQGLDLPLQQPDEPAGGTQRPARQPRPRDRYGRPRYRGRR